jgi:translation elongation factor EF-Ts
MNLPAFQEEFQFTGKKLAMHLVASKPMYLSKNDVPKEFMEKEMAIFRSIEFVFFAIQ